MDHVIGAGVRSISKGIAVASEAVVARKQKDKSPESNVATQVVSQDSGEEAEEEVDVIDQQWQLDEIAVDVLPPDSETLADEQRTTQSSNVENNITQLQPLPLPVIIPQRRPGTRSRGFVRAYAPSLGECSNIDQAAFLKFLDDFDKGSKTSPIFDVINIACTGVGFVPSTICFAVSTSVGVANKFVQEIQRRYRTNKFMDDVNNNLFKPRKLYAMVMAYRPDLPDEAILRADMSDDIHGVALQKILDREDNVLKSRLARLRGTSGTVRNDLQIPVPAPLVYPMLDRAIEMAASSTSTQAALSDASHIPSGQVTSPSDTAGEVTHNDSTSTADSRRAKLTAIVNMPAVQDYLDRRAQADFIMKNPNSKLSEALPPQKKYVNRFADPDHPVNSGSIFGLLSGGTFDPIAKGRVLRADFKARRHDEQPLTQEEKHDAYMGRKVRGRVTGTPSKEIPIVGKILKQDVLYLVIVNMPSETEIQQVIGQLG